MIQTFVRPTWKEITHWKKKTKSHYITSPCWYRTFCINTWKSNRKKGSGEGEYAARGISGSWGRRTCKKLLEAMSGLGLPPAGIVWRCMRKKWWLPHPMSSPTPTQHSHQGLCHKQWVSRGLSPATVAAKVCTHTGTSGQFVSLPSWHPSLTFHFQLWLIRSKRIQVGSQFWTSKETLEKEMGILGLSCRQYWACSESYTCRKENAKAPDLETALLWVSSGSLYPKKGSHFLEGRWDLLVPQRTDYLGWELESPKCTR